MRKKADKNEGKEFVKRKRKTFTYLYKYHNQKYIFNRRLFTTYGYKALKYAIIFDYRTCINKQIVILVIFALARRLAPFCLKVDDFLPHSILQNICIHIGYSK